MSEASQHPAGGKARRRRERGQSLVEFALVLPIFLLVVFAIVDFGMGFRAWISVTNAAREGARVGAVRGTCDAIRTQVKNTSGGLVNSDGQVTIKSPTVDDCDTSAGEDIEVIVTYDYQLVSPLGGMLSILGGDIDSTFTIKSSSHMRVE